MQLRFARYDKGGEEHFNILSAYHKSLRGSDPDAALYWMARMIEGGSGPAHHLPPRLAMAAEDIGMADPEGAAARRRRARGVPRARPARGIPAARRDDHLPGDGAEVERVVPRAQRRPRRRAAHTRAPVPLHIRNAPTKLMKDLGYHEGYRYAHDFDEGGVAAAAPARRAARRPLLRARPVRLREGHPQAPRLVGVTLENNVLTIAAEKKFERDEKVKEGDYRLFERRYGRFQRSFTVPPTVRGDACEASFEHGILKVRLPKSEEAKPRRIRIGTGSGGRSLEGNGSNG
jgi:hypothetical protein